MKRLWILATACLIGVSGCGYPEVSPKTYELAKALYSACNRRSPEHLEKVDHLAEAARESGEITEKESQWIRNIVEQARSGEWEPAALESRQLMEDQVRG
ncbi:hypothetical protein Mal4_53770 [Maioricimonas rarisocia]|uniref:Lipoprotein n=1 Tax=Maioricimonas rarisocia TaxID=2528026 RepID=A0A517ZF05_9PLAN|nr:hypothetical protein [Maioricimonas rarisocia]QDU41012.1 hypothetical protein Mal4_53770 [Maioricimonas rarisocia]